MANTFKVVNFAAEPASAGTAYKMYTVAGSTTTVVLGLILTNIHSSAVTAEVELNNSENISWNRYRSTICTSFRFLFDLIESCYQAHCWINKCCEKTTD